MTQDVKSGELPEEEEEEEEEEEAAAEEEAEEESSSTVATVTSSTERKGRGRDGDAGVPVHELRLLSPVHELRLLSSSSLVLIPLPPSRRRQRERQMALHPVLGLRHC